MKNILYTERNIEQTKSLISNLSLERLEFIYDFYCNPSKTILCQKEFGFLLHKKTIEQELDSRRIEVLLLGAPDKVD